MGRIGIRQYTLLAILALTAVIVATFVVQKTILTQAAPGINKTINFQGKMTNASGLNVPNGTYQFVFRLYNVASGGSAAWTETVSLPVTDGIFHHNLGSVSALPGSVDFDTDNIFLGITFNSDPAGEMSPRVQLTASPYAFNSDKLDGLDASDFLQLDPSTAQLGSIAITGNIAAGGTATASRFISNVATGTAPLTVTSTTMVANLNADLLDGQHGAYYRNASNINAGTLSDARLSANVSLLGQTIGLSELEANSVDSSKVVNNSLTADDLAANSVDSSEIVDGSVDESHLNITNAPTAGNVLQFGGSNNFTWVNPATLPTSGVSSLNALTGSLTLQGNAQVGVSSAGSVISLSIQNDSIGDAQLAFNTGQHLTVTSSPTFAGLTVNGDITMAGSNTLDLNSGRIAFAKSGLNKFSNLAAFDTSGSVTGAIVIKTNIPRNSRMNWVRFKGYNYTSNPILDLTIAGYWYNSGYSWNNRGFVNNGGRTPSNVQFGVDSSDNVVIIIGSTTDTWSYPHFLVDEWVIGTGNASNADASNWQIAIEDDLSAYSNTMAVANDSFTPYDSQYVNVTGDTMAGALTVNSTVTATLFSGSGASLTNLNASNLASGTVPVARVSGSYTGITGTGALNAGSITSGFGNINIGTATFTGNGSGLTNLNGSNISTGTIANARLTGSGALTVTAGSGLTGGGSVALGGSTTINVGADAITDTHLAFNTGQHLTVTSTPTFSSLNLGSSGVLRFGGTAGYAYTSKPRYTVDNTTLLSDFDNYSRSLSFIENTASGHGYYGTYDTLKLYTNNAGIQYFYQYNGVTADTPIRYRTADYSGSGWNDWRSIASQEWANTNLVRIQGSTPGTAQSGHLNITGTAIAGSFSGNGSLLTNLNASNLATGTVPVARVSGSYTGIVGTGALNAGSITSGFGNINIGTATFTGNGSGLTNLNASNITSGTLAVANGGTGATTAAGARTNLGATTVGANFFTLTNPSAVTFARINADNTVSALSAADFRAAIGAGTGGGSVTSINVSGGTTGLTTSGGPITSSGTITLGGTLGVANGGTGASTAQAAINNISGLTTAGDLLYHNGTNATRLARGTNGQCLTSNASTILWGSCGGGISGSGSNGQVSFWTGAGSQGGSSNFFWNNSTSSLGLGTASPSARLHVDGGSILATGTHGGGNGITVTGAGTRMFFDVNKSAFRAGYVSNNQWNDANVGNYSTALGSGTIASGNYSTALGASAYAFGYVSTALGSGTEASGDYSTALGRNTTAQAFGSTVLGQFNIVQGSTSIWVGTDQLFVVGNGTDVANRSNALTVLKNGNVGIGIASPSVALDVSGTVAATLFSGSGASLTNLNASNLATGTVPVARVSGSYTGIVGTGALNAGSITSGFGNINIGTATFTGNGSGLTNLNANNISTGTLAVARGGTGASTAQAAINNLSGLTASGDLLYYNGTNATRLARGTNGQCLTSNASTILWGACGGGGITTVGTFSTTNTHAGGATISGSQIIFQAASTTAPGMVSISNQSFVGDKTFTGSTTLGDASNDTLTINGTNVLIPNNLNIDSNTLFIDSTNNRIGIGTTSLAEGKLVVQSSSHGNESSSGIVSRINVTGEPSPSNAPSNYAGYFQATLSGHEIREGETVGVYGSVVADSPFSLWSGEMIGVKGFASLQNDTYYANLYGLQGGVSASSSSWAASAYGLHIKSAQVSSGGVIHDNYGIYIQNQTAGNNDYGLYIQGADTYALWVGSGASRLDGTLEVNGPSSGGSNAPLALSVQGGNATGSYSCITPTYGLSGQCGYNGGGSSIIGGSGTSGLAGPNPSNAAAGGNGGEILIEGGAGGNVSGLYSISGSGGDIIIQGGAAGTGGTLSGSNGNVLLARDRGSVGIGTASPTELLHVAGNIRFTGRVQGDDGTVSLPAYTFQMDTNTGLYRPGPDILGVTTGGTEVARFTSGQLQMNNGTAAAPAFSFSSDGDVGLYRAGANILGVSTAGTVLARFTSNQFQVVNGTAATPAITFTSDTNTGIFRSQADALAISSGGSVMFEVNTGGANVQGLFAVATLGGGQSTHVCYGGFGILSTCSSSARYKKDIATANWGLDQIRQLRPVTYNWKEDGRAGFGFIAEEVAQISPYFAFHHNGQIEGVNYSELTSVLAAGIKQLDVIVHNEKTRLDGVVSVNQMQQATLSNLMAGMNGLEMGISQVQDQFNAGTFSSLNITGPASIQNLQVVNNLTVGNNLTVVNRIITQHITISGHVRTAGDTPTFELGTTLDVLGAVIELSGLTVEVSGNDTSGTIRLITEDDPVGLEEGHLAQINFANKFDGRPRVMLSSANAAATKAGLFVDNEQVTRDYFRLFSIDELEPNSTYELNYWIVE